MIREVINDQMAELGIPYQFGEEFEDVGEGIPDCYYVGSCSESPLATESAMQSGQIVLSGWSKTLATYADLIEYQKRIKTRFFSPVHFRTDKGAAVLEWSHENVIPSDVENVHRREAYLNYYEWSVI